MTSAHVWVGGHDCADVRATVDRNTQLVVPGPTLWVRIVSHVPTPDQGIRITAKEDMSIAGARSKQFIVWADASPPDFTVELLGGAAPHVVRIANAWRGPHDSIQSWIGNAGMIAEASDDVVVLRCSDGEGDAGFDDLRLELRTGPPVVDQVTDQRDQG